MVSVILLILMLVFEFRAYGKPEQFAAIDDAIRIVQFIRNKCIRLWMDDPKTNKYDLSKQSAIDLLRESAREGTEQLYVDNGSNEVES